MTPEPQTNGVLLEELHYEPLPEEPTDQIEHPHDDLPALDETPAPEPSPSDKSKITKVDAMREALADLGLGAKNADLADYLRTKFDLQPKNIGVLKSQAKKALLKKQGQETDAHSPAKVPETDPRAPLEAQPPIKERKRQKNADPKPQKSVNGASNGHRTVLIRHRKQPNGAVISRQPLLATIYLVEEVQSVKKVCDRMGASTVLKLIDLLES